MNESFFQIDAAALIYLLVIAGIAWVIWKRSRKLPKAVWKYSKLNHLAESTGSLRQRLGRLPFYLALAALGFFALGFIDPHLMIALETSEAPELEQEEQGKEELEEVELPTEGIALYLVLDRSGSMQEPLSRETKKRRIDMLKEVSSQFIRGNQGIGLLGRSNDMLGLITFARVAEVVSPLTLDHRVLLEKLSNLDVVQEQKQDGTAIGYAIFKTVNLIAATDYFAKQLETEGRPSYEIKSKVMVLVTDGLQNPHPLDRGHDLRTIGLQDAAAYAEEKGVRLYIINIEPLIMHPRYKAEKERLVAAAERTGGRFFLGEDDQSLLAVYREIDKLERSVLPSKRRIQAEIEEVRVAKPDEDLFRYHSFYSWFVATGMILLLSSVLLETTWLRRIP